MSENTVIYLTEVTPGLWNVSRHWADDEEPEVGFDRRSGLTLDEARDYAESLSPAEYGIQLAPRPKPVTGWTCPTCGHEYHTGGDKLPEHR